MLRRLVGIAALLALTAPLPIQAQLEVSGRAATLRVGGRLQTQYSLSSIDGADNDFFTRRARIIADITVDDFVTGRVQADFSSGASLQDGYVRLNFSPAFRVSAGQFKRAFDLFELSSSTDLSLIERDGRIEGYGPCAGVGSLCSYSRLTESLDFAGRDIGVRFDGSSGSLSYLATVTNGAGSNSPDENSRKSASGRLTFAISESLRASGQIALHDYVDPVGDDANAFAFGGDVEYGTWRDGLLVQAGVIMGDNWQLDTPTGDAPSFLTFQAVASYYHPLDGERIEGVEPIARVSWGDPNTDGDDDNGLLVTPGFMAYFMGRNKIGANFDIYAPAIGDTETSLKIQTFLYF